MGVGPESDGTVSLYYHPDLVANTDDKNLIKVIEHEGFHLLNKHIPRLVRILANETT
jgi:predicted metal-dependent peptidase